MTKSQQFIAEARKYIGVPYLYAVPAEKIGEFFDCSSFTQYLANRLGISLERSTFLQAAKNGKEISLNNIQPGDLIFYQGDKGHYDHKLLPGKYIGHVVIYTGNGQAIHAKGNAGVIEENLEIIEKFAKPPVLAKRIFE
ncbi:MAG TPA: C40 family peptidase [Candidatus Paceibacterota bacterium]